jgi:hypothetical protein
MDIIIRTGWGEMFESSPYVKELPAIFERPPPDAQGFLYGNGGELFEKNRKNR